MGVLVWIAWGLESGAQWYPLVLRNLGVGGRSISIGSNLAEDTLLECREGK